MSSKNIDRVNNKLGLLQYKLSGFLKRKDVDMDFIDMAFVAGGQGAGYITTEFARLGYYSYFYNTCKQDMVNLKNLLEEENIPSKNYDMLQLDGFDGASKVRNIGLQAIRANAEKIQEELLPNERLQDADFVWFVVALGGGTGNGSTELVTQLLSAMRNEKRIGVEIDDDGEVTNPGNASVGVIAAFPDKSEGYDIQLNAAEALLELKDLQEEGVIGSVLILDNQKLKDDWRKSEYAKRGVKWSALGNTTTSQILSEVAALVSLPGEETFDKSEFLETISTPGFFSLGKRELKKNWLQEFAKEKNIDIEGNEENEIIRELIKDIYEGGSVFASGYDYDFARHGAISIVAPKIERNEDPIINAVQIDDFKTEISNVLPSVPKIHKGVFENDHWGTIKNLKMGKDEAIIYTLAILDELPERVLKATNDAMAKKEKFSQRSNTKLSLEDVRGKTAKTTTHKKKTSVSAIDILKGNSTKKKSTNALNSLLNPKNTVEKKSDNKNPELKEKLASLVNKE